MFAPLRDFLMEHLTNSDSEAVVLLDTSAADTLETCLIARMAAGRSWSLVSRTRRSSRTCSLDHLNTAQQMIDLRLMSQKDASCNARMVSSNLTADILPVYHPLTCGKVLTRRCHAS